MANRPYQQREKRLLAEFIALNRPANRVIFNFRLGPQAFRTAGPLPSNIPKNFFDNTRMYADAAVVFPAYVELWEAKAVLDGRAIGQLLEYQLAWPGSPDDPGLAHMETRLRIVTAVARPTAMRLAASLNIEVHLFTPAWIVAEFEQWYLNVTRPIAPSSATVSGT